MDDYQIYPWDPVDSVKLQLVHFSRSVSLVTLRTPPKKKKLNKDLFGFYPNIYIVLESSHLSQSIACHKISEIGEICFTYNTQHSFFSNHIIEPHKNYENFLELVGRYR